MTPFRQRMLEDMQLRNLSPHTQVAHVRAVEPILGRKSRSGDLSFVYKRVQALTLINGELGEFGVYEDPLNTGISANSPTRESDYKTVALPFSYIGKGFFVSTYNTICTCEKPEHTTADLKTEGINRGNARSSNACRASYPSSPPVPTTRLIYHEKPMNTGELRVLLDCLRSIKYQVTARCAPNRHAS